MGEDGSFTIIDEKGDKDHSGPSQEKKSKPIVVLSIFSHPIVCQSSLLCEIRRGELYFALLENKAEVPLLQKPNDGSGNIYRRFKVLKHLKERFN